ncbi:hypothetical protein MK805_17250 [Shimazuella sp. AN120528]|uniref:hypothetical protein n=1 Tax=Shimazuella soli TaxID=1892854 RepID=UPI001F0F4456|nr:hypothetical protein [Shimazuella soli]MCH5586682.1 hypothetical protein [Shimazuella soli]
MAFANTAFVSKNGNDATASIGGTPFLTINGAINAINAAGATGVTIYVYPGTYDESVVMPAGNSLRGISLLTVTIRRQNVTSDTTLLTMGENTRVEDVTLQLTSTNHVNLTGVAFPGTTSATAKLRTFVLTVDNSTASTTGTSNVLGIHSFGTGNPNESVSAIRAATVNVRSAGLGTKRAILVDTNPNSFYGRDVNLLLINAGGLGSFIGAEVNQASSTLGLRLISIQGVTADVSQTSGTLLLGSANLFNSNANGIGFTTVQNPNTIIWADPGGLPSGTIHFYRPGTGDVTPTEIFIRLSQKAVVKSLNVRAITGPGVGNTDTWTIRRNGVDTPLTVTLTGTQTANIDNNTSVTFLAGDTISLKVLTAATTSTTDSVIQVDIF